MWAFESCKIFPISILQITMDTNQAMDSKTRSNKFMVKSPEGRILLDWKLEIHLALDGSK